MRVSFPKQGWTRQMGYNHCLVLIDHKLMTNRGCLAQWDRHHHTIPKSRVQARHQCWANPADPHSWYQRWLWSCAAVVMVGPKWSFLVREPCILAGCYSHWQLILMTNKGITPTKFKLPCPKETGNPEQPVNAWWSTAAGPGLLRKTVPICSRFAARLLITAWVTNGELWCCQANSNSASGSDNSS
jgi:hypothetical protein